MTSQVAAVDGQRAPVAVLVVTGDELLRGFVQDANTGHIARELRRVGVGLAEVRLCSDDLTSIVDALRDASARAAADVVIVTGGLGPTHDDRTSEAVAAVSGRELELREDVLEVVRARVETLARQRSRADYDPMRFEDGNRKQATLPRGAEALEPAGTAPGFLVRGDDGPLFVVLPGPPPELRYAWVQALRSEALAPLLPAAPGHERLVRVWGVPESYAARELEVQGHADTAACRVTLCARGGELELSLRGEDVARVDELAGSVQEAFGRKVFAVDDERPVAAIVGSMLEQRGWRLAVAESCTGGMIGSLVTDHDGASSWFVGGVVAYANDVKHEVLGVPQPDLDAHGAVSDVVARQMAAGVRTVTGADVGLSVTGIAGPGGGSPEKPVGTVWIGIDTPRRSEARLVRLPGDRATVRQRAAVAALHHVRQVVAMDLDPPGVAGSAVTGEA